jgi:hypothetical protein
LPFRRATVTDRLVVGALLVHVHPRGRSTRNLRRVVLFAGVATAVSGCGASSRLSAQELAARANSICARYRHAYRGGGSALHTPKAVVDYLDRTHPVALREERDLRALRPGPKEAAKVEQLLRDVDAANRMLVELRTVVARNQKAQALELTRRLEVNSRRTTTEARALGWTVCARRPPP